MMRLQTMQRPLLLLSLVLLGCSQQTPAARPAAPTLPAAFSPSPSALASVPASATHLATEYPSTPVPLPAHATPGVANSGRVAAIGTLSVARASHTATLLPDGKVLIAGGCTRTGCEMDDNGATAELYDPATGIFTPTGRMTTERVGHSATLLVTGQVLLAGGFSRDRVLASAELYDPETDTFEATGSMGVPRAGFSATALPGGKVVLVGGFDGSQRLASTELYDPQTGTFTATGALMTPRAEHAAAPLADGRVLVTGGSSGGENVLASAEIFDATAGTFSQTGDMTLVRYKHAASTLQDGTVLIVGGSDARDGMGRYASAERFDPRTGTFAATPKMAAARYKLTGAVVTLRTGEVLIGGGDARVELYDPTTGVFRTAAGSVGGALAFTTATLLGNGEVLLVGGYDERINPHADAWVYDLQG